MTLENLDFSTELGPIQKIITCTIEGLVEHEDLQRLMAKGAAIAPMGAHAGDLKRIRERHHHIARLSAQGMAQSLIAQITCMTQSRISTLLNTPAMQELVAYYRASHGNASEVIAERLRNVAEASVEKLETKLEQDELDANELIALAKLGLDRSGHGPQSKVHNITEHHLLDHAELQRLNREARRESLEDIVNIDTLPALPAPSDEDTGA